MNAWRAYFPDDGQTAADAAQLFPRTRNHCFTAQDAARQAVNEDYGDSAGERGLDKWFTVVVISPTGEETRWNCVNFATVQHHVQPA